MYLFLKNKTIFVFIAVSFTCIQGAQAKSIPDVKVDKISKKALPEEMMETANLIFELQLYSTSIDKFGDPKNEGEIKRILSALEKKSVNILKHAQINTTAYRVSGVALAKHLSDLNKTYNDGSRIYARMMSVSTPMLCASCHSQLPDSTSHVWKIDQKSLKGTTFERAEILFSTWHYDEALKLYDEIVRGYPGKSSSDPYEVERSLNKKLSIFLRSKRDPKAARLSFEADLKNKKLAEGISERLKFWVKSLKDIEKSQSTYESYDKPEKLLEFVNKVYSEPNESEANAPLRVYTSGLIYQALHQHPKDKYSPEFLYWLAKSDQDYNRDIFFGLSQNYLRECVVQYPKHPIAKKCYDDYASEERAQWTGSRGYDPPPGLEKDLRNLKAKLAK